jgi:plasmid stabilization system protein ParE
LQEIVDFIAQGSKRYAKLEKQRIIAAIDQLLDFPELGKSFDYKSTDARQLIFKNYLIIYRFKTKRSPGDFNHPSSRPLNNK